MLGIKFKFHWYALLFPLYLFPAIADHSECFESAILKSIYYSVLITFCGIIPHELGHALVSKWFGVSGELHVAGPVGAWFPDESGWGALARFQKISICSAGIVANLFIFSGCWLLINLFNLTPLVKNFFNGVKELNLWFAVVNILPVFPLDGGRLFSILMISLTSKIVLIRTVLFLPTLCCAYYALFHGGANEHWYSIIEIIIIFTFSVLAIFMALECENM